jgi:SAM-dependent methyltransferase
MPPGPAGWWHNPAMGSQPEIYAATAAYELAFGYRDFAAEVSALTGWAAAASGRPPRSVLELAAGPAWHAVEFADRGLDAAALDISARMCGRARERAAERGIALAVTEADMRDFSLGRRFDLAITMLDSTTYLLELDDMVAHLRAVSRHLSDHGSYIMEMSHPADYLLPVRRTVTEWSAADAGRQVSVRWGSSDDSIDPVTLITRVSVTMDYSGGDGDRVAIEEVQRCRFWPPTELAAAVRIAGGLAVAGRYGSFDGVPPGSPAAWRLITVLRRC